MILAGVGPVTTQGVKPQRDLAQTEPDAVMAPPLGPIVLRLDSIVEITDDVLLELSSLNDALRLERNAQGELEILPPANITTGNQELGVGARVLIWAETDGTGAAFGPNAGYTLPNGAVRSPDASWVLKSRLAELTEEQKRHGFPPVSPDFVVEVRSSSDALRDLRRKMEEYIANGVRLGWLIDSLDPLRRVYVYRPDAEVEILEGPVSLSGDPELPGFILNLQPVWEPAF